MPTDNELIECRILKHLLQKEIEEEEDAGKYYAAYAEQVKKAGLKPEISDVLLSISADEKKHNELLKKIVEELNIICPE